MLRVSGSCKNYLINLDTEKPPVAEVSSGLLPVYGRRSRNLEPYGNILRTEVHAHPWCDSVISKAKFGLSGYRWGLSRRPHQVLGLHAQWE